MIVAAPSLYFCKSSDYLTLYSDQQVFNNIFRFCLVWFGFVLFCHHILSLLWWLDLVKMFSFGCGIMVVFKPMEQCEQTWTDIYVRKKEKFVKKHLPNRYFCYIFPNDLIIQNIIFSSDKKWFRAYMHASVRVYVYT